MYFKIKSNVLRVIEIGAVKLEINMGNFTRGRGRFENYSRYFKNFISR